MKIQSSSIDSNEVEESARDDYELLDMDYNHDDGIYSHENGNNILQNASYYKFTKKKASIPKEKPSMKKIHYKVYT